MASSIPKDFCPKVKMAVRQTSKNKNVPGVNTDCVQHTIGQCIWRKTQVLRLLVLIRTFLPGEKEGEQIGTGMGGVPGDHI